MSGIEIHRKIETYDESDALHDIDRCLVSSIESSNEEDRKKSITLLWKLALATGSLQSLLRICEHVLKLNICPRLDNQSRDFFKNTTSYFGPTLITKDRVMYVCVRANVTSYMSIENINRYYQVKLKLPIAYVLFTHISHTLCCNICTRTLHQ